MSKTCSKSQEELFNSFFHFKWGVFCLHELKMKTTRRFDTPGLFRVKKITFCLAFRCCIACSIHYTWARWRCGSTLSENRFEWFIITASLHCKCFVCRNCKCLSAIQIQKQTLVNSTNIHVWLITSIFMLFLSKFICWIYWKIFTLC